MKKIRSKSCDHCKCEIVLAGKHSDSYVITAEDKIFCMIQYPGYSPDKDCMASYIKAKKSGNTASKNLPKKQIKHRIIQ
jgi:hypothetical protein